MNILANTGSAHSSAANPYVQGFRQVADSDFNSASRQIDIKLEIYFDEEPFVVSKADYLIDAAWLEEISADSSSILGVISSNELSFRLFNDGRFSPTNSTGPFYGKIKAGVPVKLFARTLNANIEWTQLGLYFVTGWDARVTGTYADVVANDIWYYIFSSQMVNYPVTQNISYYTLLTEVFSALSYTVTVDAALTTVLPYAYISKSLKNFLSGLLPSSLAFAMCDKAGAPMIEAFVKARTLRATLYDTDQIKIIDAKQSITKAYDGVTINYVIPKLSDVTELVAAIQIEVPVGTSTIQNIAYTYSPVWDLTHVIVRDIDNTVNVVSYDSTQELLSVTVNNTGAAAALIDVYAYGKFVDYTPVVLTDTGTALLQAGNEYIQTAAHAAVVKDILNNFVTVDSSTLTAQIRGNPLLSIGDKVTFSSVKYNINFTGIIQRLKYQYIGGLDCEITVLNTDIFV